MQFGEFILPFFGCEQGLRGHRMGKYKVRFECGRVVGDGRYVQVGTRDQHRFAA